MNTNNILLAIGGTGEKVALAYLMLASAGIRSLPSTHIRVVDFDGDNGMLRRLTETLNICSNFKKLVAKLGVNCWMASEISAPTTGNEYIWSWNGETSTLGNLIKTHYDDKGEIPYLINALYETERPTYKGHKSKFEGDLEVPLRTGFQGKPRIGSLALSYAFLEDYKGGQGDGFWNKFKRELLDTGSMKLMVVGSLFGGMGASGIPTLTRHIADELCDTMNTNNNDVSIGVLMMEPYYSLISQDEELPANDDELNLNCKLALRYYSVSGWLNTSLQKFCPQVYIVGNNPRVRMKTEDGGLAPVNKNTIANSAQNNPALDTEITAALCARQYFNSSEQHPVARLPIFNGTERNSFNIFPSNSGLEQALKRMALFSLLWTFVEVNKPQQKGQALALFTELPDIRKALRTKNLDTFNKDWADNTAVARKYAETIQIWLRQILQNQANGNKFFPDYESTLGSILDKKVIGYDIMGIPVDDLWREKLFDKIKETKKATRKADFSDYEVLIRALLEFCNDKFPNQGGQQ